MSGTHAAICDLYYKHVKIVNDDSSIINKWRFKLIDDAKVVIYDRNRFIKQAIWQKLAADLSWLKFLCTFP